MQILEHYVSLKIADIEPSGYSPVGTSKTVVATRGSASAKVLG